MTAGDPQQGIGLERGRHIVAFGGQIGHAFCLSGIVTVFLMADAAMSAKAGKKTPIGYYNVERMLKGVIVGKGRVLLCGPCMDAGGLMETDLLASTERSTVSELATGTIEAERVLVFLT